MKNLIIFSFYNFIQEVNLIYFLKRFYYFFKKKKTIIKSFYFKSIKKSKKIYKSLKLKKKTKFFVKNKLKLKIKKAPNSFFFKYLKKKKNKFKAINYSKRFLSILIQNRNLLNYFYLNIKKSKKISKFVKIFNCFNTDKKIQILDNMLWHILLKSNFIFSINDLKFLLKFNLVLVNYKITKTKDLFLKQFDIVNLILNNLYYNYVKYRYSLLTRFFKKFKKKKLKLKLFTFSVYSKDSDKNLFKSRKIFNYLFLFLNYNTHNTEVDYTSFSILILEPVKRHIYLKNMYKKLISVHLWKLYNWKWII